MNTKYTTLRQLDKNLVGLSAKQLYTPKTGWVRTLRKAFGMTIKQLAKRLEVDASRVVRIETDETKGSVTLRSLEAVADALNCRLVYTFVPKAENFTALIEQQAQQAAAQQVKTVNHTMELEAQGMDKADIQAQEKWVAHELLQRSWKYLWENDDV